MLVKFRPGCCGLLLRLFKHFKCGTEGVDEQLRSRGATSQSSACGELDSHVIGASDWHQNTLRQFDLNGAVHYAVSSYNIEVNNRSSG